MEIRQVLKGENHQQEERERGRKKKNLENNHHHLPDAHSLVVLLSGLAHSTREQSAVKCKGEKKKRCNYTNMSCDILGNNYIIFT